jgi:glutaredoxin 3
LTDIVIYTTGFCPYCYRAKSLLDSKNVVYKEIDVTMNVSKRREMSQMAGSSSVPQIFVDGEHLGDCDGIHMLERQGVLDQSLGITS